MSAGHDDALVSWLVDEVASLREELGRLRGELAEAHRHAVVSMEPAIATSLPPAAVPAPTLPEVADERSVWDEPSHVIEIPRGDHRLSRRQAFAALGGVTGAAAAAALLWKPTDVAAAPPSGGHSSTTLASAASAGATTVTITDTNLISGAPAGAGSYGIGLGMTLVIDSGPAMEIRYVLAVSGDTITVDALSSAHASGALVYVVPSPLGLFDASLQGSYPLNSAFAYGRRFTETPSSGYVNAVLGIFSEGVGPSSYTWPLTVILTSTSDAGAGGNLSKANDFSILSRLIANGVGFSSALFLDVWHMGITAGGNTGFTIGLDMELHKQQTLGTLWGLNISNQGPQTTVPNLPSTPTPAASAYGDVGLNIQGAPKNGWNTGISINSGWQTGLLIQQGDPTLAYPYQGASPNAGIVVDSGLGVPTTVGTSTGLMLKNAFTVGIDMGYNDIQLHQGHKVVFGIENNTYFKVDTDGYLKMYRDGQYVKTIG